MRIVLLLPLLISLFVFQAKSQTNEQKLGKQTFELLKQSQGLYENEKALALVTEVGRDLEKHLTLPYPLSYHLLDVSDPNAFATAGGYVFVTRGLLALLNSRDELAGVMAHELTHVTQHHVKKQITAGTIPMILELPGNIIGALTFKELGSIINLPIAIPSQLALKSFSRKQENEADVLGVDLAAKAGYDPFGLAIILPRLTHYVEVQTGERMHKSLFLDHPMTTDRVSNLNQHLAKVGYKQQAYATGTNLKALDGIVYGQNPLEGIVHENKYLHIQLKLYCEFPEKWGIQNSPVSISAVAPDKRSTIIVSVDTNADTPQVAAATELKAINPVNILFVKDTTINRLPAVLANVRNRQIKYSDHISEILWIKLPESSTLLKVVGLTNYKKPDPAVAKSLGSFRILQPSDFSHLTYSKIILRPIAEIKLVESYINAPAVQLINGYKAGDPLPDSKYLKVIESYPLSGF
jgi:predicted Zn-dependent protease